MRADMCAHTYIKFVKAKARKLSVLPPGDWRLSVPRHSDDNMAGNASLISAVKAMALSKGCTPA